MKTPSQSRRNGYESDDDRIRYKLNKNFNNSLKSPSKLKQSMKISYDDDENTRYKFPPNISKAKIESKPKPKSKIKVNFWSNKDNSSGSRIHSTEKKSNRRHTIGVANASVIKSKAPVKVLKRVSFLPTPVFSDNHIPMVTVPDDLTIQLNEEEANDLHDDLNQAFVNHANSESTNNQKKKTINSIPQNSLKRKRSHDSADSRIDGNANELEFFSKYIVQKLRKMETNQRIYSENLINTVLMLGQLSKLSGKSKVRDT